MVVPFIALVVVILVVIFFVARNVKNKDVGNRPGE